MSSGKDRIRIRMYRQGLGDCFLLTFHPGSNPIHMLFDCGTLGAPTTGVTMQDVVANIAAETGSHLDLLIATHEHKDHVSGFNSQRDVFETFDIDRVWAAWTENPNDALAQDVKRYTGDLAASLRIAGNALAMDGDAPGSFTDETRSTVRELLGFAGDLPEAGEPLGADFAKTIHAAMSWVTTEAPAEPTQFLKPGKVLEPEWLPGVRFYVLGPPRSKEALFNLGDHDSPDLYHLTERSGRGPGRALEFSISGKTLGDYRYTLDIEARDAFDTTMPFDAGFRIEANEEDARTRFFQSYDDAASGWRTIGQEWVHSLPDLALQLDNATNNTSLVLAIEVIDDGRVLLFPADAQLGNWRSWQDLEFEVTDPGGQARVVRTDDLLRQTVFYKAGHHGSHNATRSDHGLEAMERPDLVAMIPVDRTLALGKNPPWQMPADALNIRLLEKTQGRTLRSDTGWPARGDRPASIPAKAWSAARKKARVTVEDLYIDFVLR